MVFHVPVSITDPRKLTQAVLQITGMLDMYQAELARVPQVQCGDIGRLASVQQLLEPDTVAREQAQLLVRFDRALYENLRGDGVAMRHWLRVDNAVLDGAPRLLIVDEGRPPEIVDCMDRSDALFL